MGVTKIQWARYTWNPWWGCTRVSPGCAHCYAERQAVRFNVRWGDNQARRPASAKVMASPLGWDHAAAKAGVRERVFCGSMMDWADRLAPPGSLAKMWATIRITPNLDWLLLTKRTDRIRESLPEDWGNGYPNVWLGTTTENQEMFDRRWPVLKSIPAAVRFLSQEPLLGPIDMRLKAGDVVPDWIIAGGESGSSARPCALEWIEDLVDQAKIMGIAAFLKQMGGFVVSEDRRITKPEDREFFKDSIHPDGWAWRAGTVDPKGGDIEEFPEEIRVRELPIPRAVRA